VRYTTPRGREAAKGVGHVGAVADDCIPGCCDGRDPRVRSFSITRGNIVGRIKARRGESADGNFEPRTALPGDQLASFEEAVYFSAVTFTTLGFGGITLIDHDRRLLSGARR